MFRCLLCGILVTGLTTASPAAEDDQIRDDRPEKALANVAVRQQIEILGGSAQANANMLRPQLDHLLMSEIGKIDAECSLTTEQVRKLQLAGRGDIHHVMDELFQIERDSVARARRGDAGVNMQKEVRRRVLAPAQNPFTRPSLFRKVLGRTLTVEQQRRWFEAEEAEHHTRLQTALTAIYAANAPLQDGQDVSLADRLRSRYPEWLATSSGPLTNSVVMLMIAELGEELKPLLSEQQWQYTVAFVKTAAQREVVLRDYGLWPIPAASTR